MQRRLSSAIQIGNPVSIKKATRTLQKFNGIVEEADEHELADAASRGDLHGLYNDPHTGVALAALFKQIEKGNIKRGEKAVVISTANGLKFTEFKVQFHSNQIEKTDKKLVNSILNCKAEIGAVMDIISNL